MKLLKNLALMGVLSSTLLFVPMIAMASTPSDASLLRLMQVTQVQKNFDESFANGFSQSATENMIYTLKQSQSMNSEQEAKIRQIATKHFVIMSQQILADGQIKQLLIDEYIRIAKTHYTQAEVDALIDFYGTPMGQGIIQKEFKMIDEIVGVIAAQAAPIDDKFLENNSDMLKQMFDEIGKALNE